MKKKIILSPSFWATSLLTAKELYEYSNIKDKIVSSECLGLIWGNKKGNDFFPIYGTATQLIEKRNRNGVVGSDPFKRAVHMAWSGLEIGNLNILGSFHSHPWSDKEISKIYKEGYTDSFFWGVSDEDKDSMANDSIEIVLSIRPLTSVDSSFYYWDEHESIVSGRHDVAHVSFSGWYKSKNEKVHQIPVEIPFKNEINLLLKTLDNKSVKRTRNAKRYPISIFDNLLK